MLVRMSQGAQAECVADAAKSVRSRLRSNLLPRGSLQEQVEPGAAAENGSVTSEPARAAHLPGESIRSPLSVRCILHLGDRARSGVVRYQSTRRRRRVPAAPCTTRSQNN
jgi:hypothetical protein